MNDNISYAEYIMEQLNLSYSGYITNQLDRTISFTEYLRSCDTKKYKRIEKIKKLFLK
jgi:hypothetical protein